MEALDRGPQGETAGAAADPSPGMGPRCGAGATAMGEPQKPGVVNVEEKEQPPPPPAAPPVYQPLSLQDAAVKFLSRHLDVFVDRRNHGMTIPVSDFLRVIAAAPAQERLACAELMQRVVANLPCLDCPEVDDAYWRPVVQASVGVTTCPIAEPYPALVARLRGIKESLDAWIAWRQQATHVQKKKPPPAIPAPAAAPSAAAPPAKAAKKADKEKEKEKEKGKSKEKEKLKSKDKGKGEEKPRSKSEEKDKKRKKEKQPSPSSPAPAKAAKKAAKSSPSSSAAAAVAAKAKPPAEESTVVIRPASHEEEHAALRMLKELDRVPVSARLLADTRIGDAVTRLTKLEQPVAPAAVIKAAKALRRKWKELVRQEGEQQRATEDDEEEEEATDGDEVMTPLAIGRRAVAATTWRAVYEFAADYERRRRSRVGKRAQALAEDHEAQRHRTKAVVPWSTEDEEREARRASKRPPPGNTERIRKMLRLAPPVKPRERPFGGLVFVPNKKKKLKLKL